MQIQIGQKGWKTGAVGRWFKKLVKIFIENQSVAEGAFKLMA